MARPGAPPPGWYPDPGRRHELRWWDGGRWTDHVSDGGAVRADPLPPVPPRPGGPGPSAPGPSGPGPSAPGPSAPGPSGPGPVVGGEVRFDPGPWLEAYSVVVRRAAADRAVPTTFDVRDAAGTPLLTVVPVPPLRAANAPRRRFGAAVGSDLMLVTPADVPVARLARAGPGERLMLLLPSGAVLGSVARPQTAAAQGPAAGDVLPSVIAGAAPQLVLTLGAESAAPAWGTLRPLGSGESEIVTSAGLLIATVRTTMGEPASRKRWVEAEYLLSYRSDVTSVERLLTITTLLTLDISVTQALPA